MQGNKPRFHILDLIRGLAVFLMILSHSVYFFHVRSNQFLLDIETLGNTFCFVAFLLVSGATAYVAYINNTDTIKRRKDLWRRLLVLLGSYYLIALFVAWPDLIGADAAGKFKLIFDILVWRHLPSYTEYILPFIIYPWLLSLTFSWLPAHLKNFTKIAIASVLLYLTGYALSQMSLPSYLVPWQALLTGADGYYRFPVLQYSPIYLIGLYWGSRLIHGESMLAKKRFIFWAGLVSLLILAVFAYIGRSIGLEWSVLLKRWPPSPAFLSLGLFLTFLVTYLFYNWNRSNRIRLIRDFLLLVGQNAFALFWAHIFLLNIYKLAGGALSSSLWYFFAAFVLLWLMCFALAIVLPFNLKFALNFVRYSHEQAEDYWERSALLKFEEDVAQSSNHERLLFSRYFFPSDNGGLRRRKLIRKRHLMLGVILGTLIAVLFSPLVVNEIKKGDSLGNASNWWDDSYTYRASLSISNQSLLGDLPRGSEVKVIFDHSQIVANNQAKSDGSDIRLLYFNGEAWQELPFGLVNSWNRNNTAIVFALYSRITPQKDDGRYYLYYGNFAAGDPGYKFISGNQGQNYSYKFSQAETRPLMLNLDRRWYLLGESGNNLKITVESNIGLDQADVEYVLIDQNKNGKLSKQGDSYFGILPISQLKPGNYQIQARASKDGITYYSQKATFFVSYPLYVAWTIDWEGYDANNSYLSAMEGIADKYDLPMTHYYNPRTTLTSTISSDRKEYLLNWLKDRIGQGDDLALHLHMFYDLVEASGVTVRTEPRWDGGSDGYNIPVSAYSSDELKQIISRAREEVVSSGLPEPDIFRAGAWFAEEQTLQTLAEMGFKADSSGRTSYTFGSNKMVGPWNLQSTTQPYKPSANDQNTGSLNNAINILEIPDNGADSYWFSAEDMIKRFKDNFSGSSLKQMKQFTFLSHPHWFKAAEQERVKNLLEYISQYKYSDDHGPVIYVTSDQIYDAWMKQ